MTGEDQTELFRRGTPLAAAMKLSLHRSAIQAQKYHADVGISENPATDLLGECGGQESGSF